MPFFDIGRKEFFKSASAELTQSTYVTVTHKCCVNEDSVAAW